MRRGRARSITARTALLAAVVLLLGGSGGAPGGAEDAPRVLVSLAVILVACKLGGDLFERLKQPAVLGEILAGVIAGNLPLLGVHRLAFLHTDPTLQVIAEIGVVFLLFEVGLESDVGQMLRVGASSLLVALVGVVCPMALGWGVARALLPQLTWHAHVFIGAILTATSVGITARVLTDLGKTQTTEGRIVLGAAVIDDVMGLVVLAVVQGIVVSAGRPGAAIGAGGILLIIAKAVLFLGGALVLGPAVSRRLFRLASALRIRGLLLAVALAFCFTLAWAAHAVGLAPIVGAFAAGLVLDELSYKGLEDREPHKLETQVHPIGGFLVPVFFFVTGAKVDLRVFGDPAVLGLAGALTAAAVVGKQVCGLAVLEKGLDRLSIGIGMIPRGEVGLIFAAVGARLVLPGGVPAVDARTYGAAVVMVLVTTLVTPPVLAWSLRRRR